MRTSPKYLTRFQQRRGPAECGDRAIDGAPTRTSRPVLTVKLSRVHQYTIVSTKTHKEKITGVTAATNNAFTIWRDRVLVQMRRRRRQHQGGIQNLAVN